MRTTRSSTAAPLTALAVAALLALLAGACTDDSAMTAPDVRDRGNEQDGAPDVSPLGLVEVTIFGLGEDAQPSASVVSAASVAGLDALRRARRVGAIAPGMGGIAPQSLAPPANTDSSGNGTIQLEPVATGSFTHGERGNGGVRYLYATYRVRNAQKDGTTYDTPRQNLTFLAVGTDSTVDETAFSTLRRFDGSPADAGIASAFLPTGAVAQSREGDVVVQYADVLQVISEAETADILADAPAGVATVFPYGFVTRCAANCTDGRTLREDPAPDAFDGLVTFAFKVPLQASPADDPFTVSAVFLAVDDSETRITESLEEQGTTSVRTGADALGATASVTLLGTSATAAPGHGTRRICRVRTAGTDPDAPTATLIDEDEGCSAGAVGIPDHVILVDDDAPAGGDGRTWATAFRYLQDALSCIRDDSGVGEPCEGVGEVWVAEGVYYPDEGAGITDDDPSAAFEPIDGVAMYGGFAGGEYAREQRDWAANVTVLDGDIDQDPTSAGNATSLLHMHATGGARIGPATVVDGFTVQHASNYSGSAPRTPIYCVADGPGTECSPTLRNLTVWLNENGAMAVVGIDEGVAAPFLEDISIVENNEGLNAHAYGAMFIRAVSAGAARPTVVRTDFILNGFASGGRVVSAGGAVYAEEDLGEVDARFYNVEFRSNHANEAGAVYVGRGASLKFYNARFWRNHAESGTGGALVLRHDEAEVVLVNTTLADNEAAVAGGGIALGSASFRLENTIIWGNAPGQFDISGSPGITALHSLIEGGCPAGATCTDVFDADPGFVDFAAGDLRLLGASPAVDGGDNAFLPADAFDLDGDGNIMEPWPLDLAGRPRFVDWLGGGAVVDMGAYERQ